ncbi:hypothetical protein pEaSNUABM8_00229 [Erwinia phage pEa_SNUABM_8]|nr:hypothetical protein pEaSNUABM8_00229 [Erwinia phage pEa_SNUABM_8]QVW54981.1 hypothetical protein pEaSNUABM4_00228 [Erwinia phage pEa_SNUABM_4]
MFTQDIINKIASALNSRYYQSNLQALGSLSQLLLRKRNGSNYVTHREFSDMLHTQIENVFPVPYMRVAVDGRAGTVVIDGHMFVRPEEKAPLGHQVSLLGYNNNPWNVVIVDIHGDYHMIASGDGYAIPHGQYSVPFDMKTATSMPGVICHDNLLISGSTVTWVIQDWKGAGKILANEGTLLPIQFDRVQNIDRSPLELDTLDSLKGTFIGQDLSDSLGLEQQPYPYSVHDVVEALVETLKLVLDLQNRIPKNQTTEADKEVLGVALKIQGNIHFNDLLSEVMALPAKKRTQKALNEIIPRHLENILNALKAKK